VHDGEAVALEVLVRDDVVAEDLARRGECAVLFEEVLVRHVVVVAHHAARLDVVLAEPLVLLARHAVVREVEVHLHVDGVAVGEVEREEATFVVRVGQRLTVWVVGVEILGRLALDEDGAGLPLEYGAHRQHVCLAQIFQRAHERLVRPSGKAITG
jgi:hypothetical protein